MAKLSHCKCKQVGALIVKNRMIISMVLMELSGFDNCCEDEEGVTKWENATRRGQCYFKSSRATQSCEGATLKITPSLSVQQTHSSGRNQKSGVFQ